MSLNCDGEIDPGSVLASKTFSHPVFNQDAVLAQRRFDEINGVRGLYYCGAYWSFGFHEDGVQSARRALLSMGVEANLPGRPNELRPEYAQGSEDATPA